MNNHWHRKVARSASQVAPFEKHTLEYDLWFKQNSYAYLSELQALRQLFPAHSRSIEIGAGTGRFAAPLGITFAVEPSSNMREIARKRGVVAIPGTGEALPFKDAGFDAVLIVTTICFLRDVAQTFAQSYRVLKPGGCLVVGFIDKNSLLGSLYQQHAEKSPFYRVAKFYSSDEIMDFFKQAGFHTLSTVQTIYHRLPEINRVEPVKPGYGEGSFVVMKGLK